MGSEYDVFLSHKGDDKPEVELLASDSRRRASRAELFPGGIDRRAVDDVLAVLSHKDARLVVVNADDTVEVTHEALIQTWDTLRGWIDRNRQLMRLHRRLTESANEWKENIEDASILYRGGRLEDVKDLQTSPGIALNKIELAFLEASVSERKREEEEKQRQLRRELDAARKLAETEGQRAGAEIKARHRQSNFFIVLTTLLILVGTIIAIFVPVFNARNQIGISITAAQFSPDSQRVVTTSFDTTRLWDASTGKPIGEPMKHGGGAFDVPLNRSARSCLFGLLDAALGFLT